MRKVGDIKVSIKQARRVFVLEQLLQGKTTNNEAAIALGLSIRQVQRAKSLHGAIDDATGNPAAIDEANVFLRSYLQKHNDLFAALP